VRVTSDDNVSLKMSMETVKYWRTKLNYYRLFQLTSSMASPLAGTAQEGGSMTCELKTTLSSDTLRARDDAAIAITSSVLREVANDSCGGRFNRDR